MAPRTPDSGATALHLPSRRTILRAGLPAALALAGGATLIGAPAQAQSGPTDTELAIELTERVKAYLATTGTQTEASVAVSRGSRFVSTSGKKIHDTASVVKMEILLMLLEKYNGVAAIPANLKEFARQMITASNNDATTSLYNSLGGCDALSAAHARYGLSYTVSSPDCRWGLTKTNVGDQIKVLNHLLYQGLLVEDEVKYARSLMGGVVASQKWGVTAAANSNETVWLKNGWDTRASLGGLWVVHSVGTIYIPNYAAVRMAILTSKAPNQSKGVAIVEEIARISRSVINKAR